MLPLLHKRLAVFDDVAEVIEGPAYEVVDVGQERAGTVGEFIFHAGRHLGIGVAQHEAVGFEVAQDLGEHFLRDVGDGGFKGLETHGLLGFVEGEQHENRPLVAYPCNDVTDRALRKYRVNNLFFRHKSSIIL